MGYNTIDRVHRTQYREMDKIQLKTGGELSAFEEGTIGWAADKANLQLPNGQDIPVRVTTVFHKEDGEWKIVQHHVSVGVPNVEIIGRQLTVK